MATEAQINANRKNATRSTGPKTPAGKKSSSRNALRHGLLAREIVLPNEDRDEFDAFMEQVREDLLPQGPVEELLCDRVITAAWRLIRAARVEASLFALALSAERMESSEREAERYLHDPLEHAIDLARLSSKRVTNEEAYLDAQLEIHEAEQLAKTDLARWGRAFVQERLGANALLLLARYETSIERSLFRALDALEHEQKRRKEADSAIPPRDG
jgi:hypothetical protein